MRTNIEQYSSVNFNPVLSVTKDSTVLYSNEAGKPLLQEWGVEVGTKLPSNIGDLIQSVISRNNPEKMEVKVGKKVYMIVFHPIPEQGCVNISGFDISDHKEFEEKQRESGKNYQKLFEIMNEAFFIADVINDESGIPVDYRIIEANKAIETHTGVPLEIFIGNTALGTDTGLDPFWIHTYGHVALTGEPIHFEHYADVQKRYYEVSAYQTRPGQFAAVFCDITERKQAEKTLRESEKPLRLDMLNPVALVGVSRDITRQKQTEEALRVNEELYRILFDSIDEGFCIIEKVAAKSEGLKDFRYIAVNPAFEKNTGLKNAVGKTILDLVPEAEQSIMEIYDKVALKGEPIRFERYVKSLDLWIDVYAFRIDDPILCRVAVLFQNVTERKKAEEMFKRANATLEEKVKKRTTELEKANESLKESKKSLAEAQEMAHIGNWEWDIVTDEAYWSEEMYRIFKRDPQKLAPSLKEYLSYIHPEDLDYYCDGTHNTKKVSTSGVDFRIVLANGEERTLHIKSDLIFNDENIPIRVKGIVQDITERKKVEDALVKAEIVRKQEIHHRIKNNLQVISSLLDLQAEKFRGRKNLEDSEVCEAFRESQDRVISMALIHEELHKSGEFDTLNFSQYINELADNLLLSYRVGNNCISLDTDIKEDIFFDIDTAVPLGIIINELISNSLKHAFFDRDEGKIGIELHREKTGEFSSIFTLSVSDNGVGISENINFENLDSLGMQLVTTLVDQLAGELELNRNNGTEFIIRFIVTEKNNHTSATATQLNE